MPMSSSGICSNVLHLLLSTDKEPKVWDQVTGSPRCPDFPHPQTQTEALIIVWTSYFTVQPGYLNHLSLSLSCVLKYAQSATALCKVLRKYLLAQPLVVQPFSPIGTTVKTTWEDCDATLQVVVPAQTPARMRHPEWTQREENIHF